MDNLKRYPFVRLLIPFVAGILLSKLALLNVWITICIPLILFVGLVFIYFFKKRIYDSIFNCLVYLFLFIIAWGLSSEKNRTKQDLRLADYSGQIIGEVLYEPDIGSKNVKLIVEAEALKIGDSWYGTTGNIQIYLPIEDRAVSLKPGDRLIFSPTLNEFENRGNPNEFDYKAYMWQQYVRYVDYLRSDEWKKIDNSLNNSIERYASQIRNFVIEIYKKAGLKNDELGVATALTLGNKSYLNDEIRQAYSISGGMHVLAVSGLHVGVFYLVISWLLSFIKNKKFQIIKTILIVLLIWFYAGLTGLAPSVVRAATMFSLFSFAKITHRNSNSINVLAASAFIALVFNPATLFQVGFLLSHFAVFSIVYFYPKIYSWWMPSNKLFEKLWSLIAVSTAAQIGTIPFTIYYFNQFPTYFLLTNVIIIPMVSIAIYLGIALVAFSFIPFLSKILAWLFAKSIGLMNSSVVWIENLPSSSIEGLYITDFQFFLLLALMMFIILLLETRSYKYFVSSLIVVLVFCICSLTLNYKSLKQTNFIVYNLNNSTAINLIDAKTNVLFYTIYKNNSNNIQDGFKSYWNSIKSNKAQLINFEDLRPERVLSNIVKINNNHVFTKYGFFGFYSFRFMVPNSEHEKLINCNYKIPVDCVVYTNKCKMSLEELLSFVNFKTLIVDASVNRKFIDIIAKESAFYNIDVFYTDKFGAFMLSDLRKL